MQRAFVADGCNEDAFVPLSADGAVLASHLPLRHTLADRPSAFGRERLMNVEIRKSLVWATIAAAVVSAVLLAASGGSIPRADAAARTGSASMAPTAAAH